MNEVQAAAERLTHPSGLLLYDSLVNDCDDVASMVLADGRLVAEYLDARERQATEDAEPITEDLLDRYFPPLFDKRSRHWAVTSKPMLCIRWDSVDGYIAVYNNAPLILLVEFCDLRKLCEALGIELKEQTDA